MSTVALHLHQIVHQIVTLPHCDVGRDEGGASKKENVQLIKLILFSLSQSYRTHFIVNHNILVIQHQLKDQFIKIIT